MTTTAATHRRLTPAAAAVLEELGVRIIEERWGHLLLHDYQTWWAASVAVMEAAAEAVADADQFQADAYRTASAVRYEALIDAMDAAGYDGGAGDNARTVAELYTVAHGMTDGETWGTARLPEDADTVERVWVADAGDGPEEATLATLCRWDGDGDGDGIILAGWLWDLAAETPLTWWLEEDMDAYAEEDAPEGFTVRRGSYTGTTDDRRDRWYVERTDADAVDRRGRGHATLGSALRAAEAMQEAGQ